MYLDYVLDIEDRSMWLIATPREFVTDPPFIVDEIGVFYAKRDYFTVRRDKNDFLLLYTTSGAGLLYYLDQEWKLVPGTVVFIDCKQYHRYQTSTQDAESWGFYWMHVSGAHCPFYYDAIYPKGFCLVGVKEDKTIARQFKQMLLIYENPHINTYCGLSNYVSDILTQIVRLDDAERQCVQPHEENINRSVAYIKAHYRDALNLDELARQVNLSKYYFLRLFKEYMQVTPYRFLLYHRINEAKKLLRTTDRKIVQISEMVGFSDESNFNRTFKSVTGLTPLQYRRTA